MVLGKYELTFDLILKYCAEEENEIAINTLIIIILFFINRFFVVRMFLQRKEKLSVFANVFLGEGVPMVARS